ncbi:MAG: ATP-binding protein [Myxococcaceae bacterium]
MERAIESMKKSVAEPRDDGKASPLVGVVLRKQDGTLEDAWRGELRHGDHAEYTLLERKNPGSKLDGAVLFSTLEPCAPGARRHPKLGCAERIVLARISEVWVGIEDPDPTVDRKGIKYLERSGVTVHLFDRDLQERIREANRNFIDQALERAAKLDEKPEGITLSKFEHAIGTTAVRDLSPEAMERYRSIAGIEEPVDSEAFRRRLVQQGLLVEAGSKFVPTGFGFLLFGKEPRTVLPQAGLLGTIHFPSGEEEPRDFDGPLVLIPEAVEKWLTDKLPSTVDRSRMRRKRLEPLPFELVREAVVNALVHRDYEIRGAKCQLVVTADTVVVKSPGGPVPPLTLPQLQSLAAPMLSRNPLLHFVFARMDLAEERGLGMKSFKSVSQARGLPLPKFTFDDPYLSLTLYRSPESAVHVLAPAVLEELNNDERAGWEFVASRESTRMAEYARQLGFDARKAQRHLSKFVALKLLARVGAGPATEYRHP